MDFRFFSTNSEIPAATGPDGRFEVALLDVGIARNERFAGEYPSPTRERGTHEGRRRERRNSFPRLRVGL
jgi:hypothetical protein